MDDFDDFMPSVDDIINEGKEELESKEKTQHFLETVKLPYKLYDLQEDAIALLRNKKQVMLEVPTGSGKTTIGIIGKVLDAKDNGRTVEYYFSSHQQAEEVISTINKLNQLNPDKPPIRAIHVAGRSRLCNFADIRQNRSEKDRLTMCKINSENNRCLITFKSDQVNSFIEETPCMTSKEILEFSEETYFRKNNESCRFCPRTIMKQAMIQADIIALPIIYLFLPSFSSLHKVGSDIIIDEAHGFDSKATEFMSSSLSLSQLKETISEFDSTVDNVIGNIATVHFDNIALGHLTRIFKRLNLLDFGKNNMDQLEVDLETIGYINNAIRKYIGARYSEDGEEESFITEEPEYMEATKLFFLRFETAMNNKEKYSFNKERKNKNAVSFKLKCLDPSLSYRLNTAFSESVVLMSGTLNPDFMSKVLDVPTFSSKSYESIHKNIMGFYIKDIKGEIVNSSYNMRGDEMTNRFAVGVFNVISITPKGGILVFTTNYALAEELFNKYNFGIPKYYGGNTGDLDLFKKLTKDGRKAIFISALRGSGAEGVNFPDDEARAICILGVPYVNLNDEDTIAQYNFYENSYGKDFAKRWALREAAVAVGQAFGRGNRHPDDYCTVFLFDSRMPSLISELPRWVTNSIDWSSDGFSVKLKKAKEFLQLMSKNQSK